MRVGVISDTHGLVRPEAINALQGSDLILHAGDIGKPQVLEALQDIAPVRAIRGNNDTGDWASGLPERESVTVGALRIYMLHDVKELEMDPKQSGYAVVVSGHSHTPLVQTRNDVLFLNPGSAGPRRFKLPVSVAWLHVEGAQARAELVTLEISR